MARLQLLLVDPDPRALRLTAAGLSRSGFTVTACSSVDEARVRLRAHPVDGILCAATLPGDSLTALRRERALEQVPFVLLVDGSGGGLARWEPLAPVDVVTRPVALGDLVARVRAAMDEAVRARLEAGAEEAFHSSVDRMSVLDLVEFFRAQGRSGTVGFSGARDGRLVFHAGVPVDAAAGVQTGREAFFRLLAAREGAYELKLEETSPGGNLEGAADALVDEGIAFLEAWDRALEQVPPLTSVLEQDAVRVADLQGTLPEEAGWVLRLVDGERTLEDLVEASTLGGLAVLEIVARLYFEGLVSVRKGGPASSRRPRVDEWLNSPPSLPLEGKAQGPTGGAPGMSRAGAPSREAQALSREESDVFAAMGMTPGAEVEALLTREEWEALVVETAAAAVSAAATAAAERAAESPARTTQSLSREELDAFAAAERAAESPARTTQSLSREELEAFAAAERAAESPARTTQSLSREELDALAAEAAPAESPAREAQSLSREELDAFAAAERAAESPARTAQSLSREELDAFAAEAAPAESPAQEAQSLSREELDALAAGAAPPAPSGFADDGGFPMGNFGAVANPAPFARAAGPADDGGFPMGSSGSVADASPFGLAQPAAPADRTPPAGAEGTFPFHHARAQVDGQDPGVQSRDPTAPVPPSPLGRDAPPPVPAEPASQAAPAEPVPPAAPGVEPFPSAEASAPSAPAAPQAAGPTPSVGVEAEEEFIPVRRNWGVGVAVVGGALLVAAGGYFATWKLAHLSERKAPVAAVEPPPPPAKPEVDDGDSAGAEAVPPPAQADAGALAARDTAPAVAPPVNNVPEDAGKVEAGPSPGPALQATPAPMPPAPLPGAAALRPALPEVAPSPAPAAQKVSAPEFDLGRVTTPAPQGATAQDRVAPGLLPRKGSVRNAPVVPENAATDSPAQGGTGTAAALRGAKRAQLQGNWKAAVDGYRKALALGADAPDVKAGLGIALVSSDPGLRGYQEATELLKQALSQDGGNANAWLSLGMAYQFTGNTPEAVKAYKRYLALAPSGKSAAEVRAMLERL